MLLEKQFSHFDADAWSDETTEGKDDRVETYKHIDGEVYAQNEIING